MPDLLTISISLGFIAMGNAIKAAVEIILVRAPRGPGHEVRDVSLSFPLGDAEIETVVRAVANSNIRAKLE